MVVMSTLMFLASPGANPEDDGVALRLEKIPKKGYVLGTPYVAPQLELQVLGGAPKGYVYGCKQTVEHRTRADHEDDIVILECAEGVRLELKGIKLQ